MENFSDADISEIQESTRRGNAPTSLPSEWIETNIGVQRVSKVSQEKITGILQGEVSGGNMTKKGESSLSLNEAATKKFGLGGTLYEDGAEDYTTCINR